MDSKYDIDNMILEFDDTHLYRDLRTAYLMEMQDKAVSDAEAISMEAFTILYTLGMADFSIDLTAEPKHRVVVYPNQPS